VQLKHDYKYILKTKRFECSQVKNKQSNQKNGLLSFRKSVIVEITNGNLQILNAKLKMFGLAEVIRNLLPVKKKKT